MESAKIRVKIGPHEFEAEGPPELVSQQFEAWKSLVVSESVGLRLADHSPPTVLPLSGTAQGAASAQASLTIIPPDLSPIFVTDDKRDLVTLRISPSGEDRHRESLLLTLYGFLRLRGQDEVLVTKLKASLESSGSAPDRIDRTAEPYQREGYLLKGGMGKGGKYRLTNKGIARAQEKVEQLLSQVT